MQPDPAPVRGSVAMTRGRQRVAWICLTLLVNLLFGGPALGYDRDKSDVVIMRNGDHISGDLLSLEYGMLTLKTDKAGTVYIEWPSVRAVSSKFHFAVERIGGGEILRRLAAHPPGGPHNKRFRRCGCADSNAGCGANLALFALVLESHQRQSLRWLHIHQGEQHQRRQH